MKLILSWWIKKRSTVTFLRDGVHKVLMVAGDEIQSILEKYDPKKISVATLGSHSALQIFKGAKEEGLRTVCISTPGREKLYKHYDLVDEFIHVSSFSDIIKPEIQDKLRKLNSIIIPHGSFSAYVDQETMENELAVPMLGNRTLLRWETSRQLQRKWLADSGIAVPRIFESKQDIDGLVFVKFPGARGGKGYFVVDSPKAYDRKMKDMIKRGLVTKEVAKQPYIQEYIIGVNVYPHYFYSPLSGEVELLGIDKRYESSVDGLDRIPVPEQISQQLNPSFSIVGNFPMVVRESMLHDIYDMGEKIVAQSKRISEKGVVGPFCLETICREDLALIAFEISARIVAGCNVFVGGSPYTYLKYSQPMYMGRRIAKEITDAVGSGRLNEIVT